MFLRGSPTVSTFRRDKLLREMRLIHADIAAVTAEYIHFVDLLAPMTADQQAVLENILRYGPLPDSRPPRGQLQLVLPRPGTISPWSSKATDIARVCGLQQVRRLERGVAWYLETPGYDTIPTGSLHRLRHLIHDRMTEVVLTDFEEAAHRLFDRADPAPLLSVDLILAEGETHRLVRLCQRLTSAAKEID